ncbi:MAG: hypothetical protein ACTSRW_10980 [Candidatus Helarchaeota archaeon]
MLSNMLRILGSNESKPINTFKREGSKLENKERIEMRVMSSGRVSIEKDLSFTNGFKS